jgi:type VI secretion system protein ImpH
MSATLSENTESCEVSASEPSNGADGAAVLLEDLRARPEAYTLFGALRLIEQAHQDSPRLGESRKAADDPVRIAQRPHLYFAPAEVAGFDSGEGAVARLEQHGFGVFGPNGVLPIHLTELAYSRQHHANDPAVADFVNAFQHRFASLFYRAWADCDPCTTFDRPDTDLFKLYAGALIGIAPRAAQDRDCVFDYAKLVRAGLFAPQSRSAESLERIITDYFELPARVVEFVGSWLDLPAGELFRLGGPREHATLGFGATLGAATWQCQSSFEIVLGPLRIADFVNFLPGARGLNQLKALVRLYTNEEWSWRARLLLEPSDIPPICLGQGGWLGWASWLGSRAEVTTEAAGDTVIEGSQPASTR